MHRFSSHKKNGDRPECDNRKIHFVFNKVNDEENFLKYESILDIIISKHIIGYSFRKTFFTEVINEGKVLESFNSFDPFFLLLLTGTAFCTINDLKYHNKMENIRNDYKKPIIKIFEFLFLVVTITLTKNIKNAM